MREGGCCDRGKFPRTRLVRQSVVLADVREEQVQVRANGHPSVRGETVAAPFGSYSSQRFLAVAQESRLSPSGDVLL